MDLLPALALVLPALAQDVPEGSSLQYACSGGARFAVAYVNPPGGDSYAVVAWEGRAIPMKAGPTGSGVRYVSLDGTGLVWHVKGDEGFLARDDAAETMILTDCAANG
jgi:membrane-bound inhibitor of C-type lysozyme